VPSAVDNCAVATITNNAPASYPIGTNFVTWTALDTSGNAAFCQQRVIVQRTCSGLNASPLTNQTVCPNSSVLFLTTATTLDPITFLWRFNGQAIPGAATNSLTLLNVGPANSGIYTMEISSPCTVITNSATLTVLPPVNVSPVSFTNDSYINISDFSIDPYPSVITPRCIPGTITKVTVRLDGFSHYFPGDVNILLVAPNQTGVKLMAGVRGDDNPVFNLVLTFSDAAVNYLPYFDPITNGLYKPTDYRNGALLPPPAPQSGYFPTLSAFNGLDPNGTWALYAYDDSAGDVGSLGGWTLNIEWRAPLLLVNPRTTTNGAFQADVLGQSGVTYVIERSTNLTSWVPFLTNVPMTNLDSFIDTNSPQFPRRFYRALQ